MNTCVEFFREVRTCFPELAARADRHHREHFGDDPNEAEDASVWFLSVADALNQDMGQAGNRDGVGEFFSYVDGVLHSAGAEVKNCIDVELVENLFWKVPPEAARAGWGLLPEALQRLYVDFHGHPPH